MGLYIYVSAMAEARDMKFLGAGVKEPCAAWWGCEKLNLGLLQEKYSLLTPKLAFRPLILLFNEEKECSHQKTEILYQLFVTRKFSVNVLNVLKKNPTITGNQKVDDLSLVQELKDVRSWDLCFWYSDSCQRCFNWLETPYLLDYLDISQIATALPPHLLASLQGSVQLLVLWYK